MSRGLAYTAYVDHNGQAYVTVKSGEQRMFATAGEALIWLKNITDNRSLCGLCGMPRIECSC